MADTIENPILNSAFAEPRRHFRFADDGITNEIVDERRPSSYFVPIPAAKRRGGQQAFETEWTKDRIEENAFINRVRGRIALWRQGGYQHVTTTTRRLLDHWADASRDRPLFFCQVEALETAIYLTEAANRIGDQWIANELRRFADDANPGLFRVAHKMATGTGKTVVMAMLIAWHTLNKAANPQDARFTDAFLVVAPGITIRDRLRVLLPSDPNNYYRERELVPPDLVDGLGRAQVVVTNFHAFQPRETTDAKASKLTKEVLAPDGASPFVESPAQMVRRVCRELGNKRGIVVLNDEAHHCYRRRATKTADEKLTAEERREADKREKAARVWIAGIEAVTAKMGVKTVYDLSATPFFLRGSGYSEGTLFPWVVSDFSLIDAIESGVVKVPRVPVSDDAMTGTGVTFRDLWPRIRDELPKKSRKDAAVGGGLEPRLPGELETALRTLYGNYAKAFRRWEASEARKLGGATPPVFIVVCNNTAVSKLVFDWLAGWEKTLPDGSTVLVPNPDTPLFSNIDGDRWRNRPNTILVDSEQLESGDVMNAEFKRAASAEIDEWKREYEARFPGRSAEDLTDEDLLREVMNTVGKPGRLGEQVRCVVSVSMLTEGWDANTVTHILGVRAFGTQLLCEQVVGRGLRRRSYVADADGMFDPEYAEVYGVPFSFIPAAGSSTDPRPGKIPTRVRALPDRAPRCEITFPRVVGYRYELSGTRLSARFDESSHLVLSTRDMPTRTDVAPIVGEIEQHTLDDLARLREQEVAFRLAKRLVERYFRDETGNEEPWLFPQALRITKRWMSDCVTLHDHCFVPMLLIREKADDAVDRMYKAIARADDTGKRLQPMLRPHDPVGTTAVVDFDTTRDVWETDPDRCHVSHVVLDSGWEAKMAETLEDMDEVFAYVKNHGLGFVVPYAIDGEQRGYLPDFIVRIDDGRGPDDPLHLVVEVSGAQRRDKEAKVATMRDHWVPAVNAHGAFGRWDFVEIVDPWNAQATTRGILDARERV
ncbi:MAG TPA: DEAD/DEAH box helicase family protein [Acidimicrobiia bacterium]|nr:DEAD/DEAH box helicase family protein [Acidimicrobiia bacterium]